MTWSRSERAKGTSMGETSDVGTPCTRVQVFLEGTPPLMCKTFSREVSWIGAPIQGLFS